jgi:hypothetical protein
MVPDLLTEHNRWSQEKKRAYVKQQKTGLRSIPGYSHKICDWWDEGYPEGKVRTCSFFLPPEIPPYVCQPNFDSLC